MRAAQHRRFRVRHLAFERVNMGPHQRLGEYHVVLGSLSLHIVPKKTRHAALAFAVDGVGDAEPLFVKPKRPFFRVIVDADAPVRSCQEVDMMAEREPGAAHSRAGFLQEIREACPILHS